MGLNPIWDMLAAVQFLTRIPVPSIPFTEKTLPRSLAYFPVVGLLLGWLAGLLNKGLAAHLPRLVAAGFVVSFLVAVTGAFHEDALADCADAFGLKRPVEKTIEIMRDSRIGSFGGSALVLSMVLRVALVAALPERRAMMFLIAALTLGRWSTLPLSLLPAALPESGQGSRVAGKAPVVSLIVGTVLMLGIVVWALGFGAIVALGASVLVIGWSGAFYMRRLGGVTGDCFGATNQLVEIAVLGCGAWVV